MFFLMPFSSSQCLWPCQVHKKAHGRLKAAMGSGRKVLWPLTEVLCHKWPRDVIMIISINNLPYCVLSIPPIQKNLLFENRTNGAPPDAR